MLFFALYSGLFLAVFNFTSCLMAGLYIVGELGGSTQISSYDVAAFGLGNASSFAIASRLGERFGRLQILRIAIVLFAISIILCTLADTFPLFVFFRFLSGVASGVFYPLGLDCLNARLSEQGQKSNFAFLAFLTSITPVLGASIGGWLAYDYNWKYIFHLQMPLIILCFCVFHIQKRTHKEKTEQKPFDLLGYVSFLLFICPLVAAATLGQELDWFRSSVINTLFLLGIFGGVFFVIWERQHKNPFMDVSLFCIPKFTLSVISLGLIYSAYFGMIILLSLWLHIEVNYTPIWIGLLLAHMVIASILLFIFMRKWVHLHSLYLPITFALLSFLISCFYSTVFNAEVNFGRIALSRVLAGFGLAFFLFPLLLLSLGSVPKEKQSQAMCIFQSARLIFGSLGISLYTTLWYRRQIFYHDRLESNLSVYENNTSGTFNALKSFSLEGTAADLLLEQGLQKQSTALALADCFYLMGWILLVLFLWILQLYIRELLQKRAKPSTKNIQAKS